MAALNRPPQIALRVVGLVVFLVLATFGRPDLVHALVAGPVCLDNGDPAPNAIPARPGRD